MRKKTEIQSEKEPEEVSEQIKRYIEQEISETQQSKQPTIEREVTELMIYTPRSEGWPETTLIPPKKNNDQRNTGEETQVYLYRQAHGRPNYKKMILTDSTDLADCFTITDDAIYRKLRKGIIT